MSRKIIMKVIAAVVSIPLALSLFVMVGTPAEAKGLTQLSDPNKIEYGTTTEKQKAVLKDFFDLDYYIAQNKDVVEKLGTTDYDVLFEHFCNSGIYEGRVCSASFNPSAYAAAYSDARDTCGKNILLYYLHYATVGKADNRTITTLEACAKNNINVTVLGDEEKKITPEVYELAAQLGITDYDAAIETKQIIDSERAKGNEVVVSVESNKASSSGNDSAGEAASTDTSGTGSESGTPDNDSAGEAASTDTSGTGSESGTPDNDSAGEAASTDTSGSGSESVTPEPASPADSSSPTEQNTPVTPEGNTDGEETTSAGLPDGYVKVATIRVGGGIDIGVYAHDGGGYAAYHIDYSNNNTGECILKAKTDDYAGNDDDMGMRIAYLPVYLFDTSNYDSFVPNIEDNSVVVVAGNDNGLEPQRVSNGTAVTTTTTYGPYFDGDEPTVVNLEAIADEKATESTQYDVGFAFGETSDGHVDFDVVVTGDDGFTINDSYNVQVGADDSVDDVDGE